MASHRFHIGDVLSITTKRIFSPRGILGIRGILAFMSGVGGPDDTSITDTGCVLLTPHCTEELIRQHPWLQEIDASGVTPENADDFLADLVRKHGEFLEVTSMN